MPDPAPEPTIPIETTPTIRERIIDAIIGTLLTIINVGLVTDAALGDEADNVGLLTSALSEGKYAIEVLPSQSEATGVSSLINDENLEMEVLLLIHLPRVEGQLPYQTAARICSTIYQLYTGPATPGTWGNLAVQTRVVSGSDGGQVFTDLRTGQKAVGHIFSVHYRHAEGDPGVAR